MTDRLIFLAVPVTFSVWDIKGHSVRPDLPDLLSVPLSLSLSLSHSVSLSFFLCLCLCLSVSVSLSLSSSLSLFLFVFRCLISIFFSLSIFPSQDRPSDTLSSSCVLYLSLSVCFVGGREREAGVFCVRRRELQELNKMQGHHFHVSF